MWVQVNGSIYLFFLPVNTTACNAPTLRAPADSLSLWQRRLTTVLFTCL